MARVLGPYRHPSGWRIVIVDDTGCRTDRLAPTEVEAKRWQQEAEEALSIVEGVTVGEALEKYAAYQKSKGNRVSSIATTMFRLRNILGESGRGKLVSVGRTALQAYADCVRLSSVDYSRNCLSEAKTFGRWCVKQGWVKVNPWEGIEPVGRKRKGKPQLRVDEARRWLAKALELATAGDEGAVAAMMTLVLGLRASEVVERVGRDVDDNGALLWIDAAKTDAGVRCVEVPQLLRGPLSHVVQNALLDVGSGGTRRIFGRHDRHWVREQVKRICRLAGVPEVGAHGMRGTHASLAMVAGASSQLVAASLGHASDAVTLAHYASPGAVASGRAESAMKALEGQ